MPLYSPLAGQRHNGYLVGLLVADEHLGLHAVVHKRLHKAIGSHGGTASLFACIYDEYSHSDSL